MFKNILYLFLIIFLPSCTNSMKENMKLDQNAKIQTKEIIKNQKEKIDENKILGPKPAKKKN